MTWTTFFLPPFEIRKLGNETLQHKLQTHQQCRKTTRKQCPHCKKTQTHNTKEKRLPQDWCHRNLHKPTVNMATVTLGKMEEFTED
jgi:hypothetical protein